MKSRPDDEPNSDFCEIWSLTIPFIFTKIDLGKIIDFNLVKNGNNYHIEIFDPDAEVQCELPSSYICVIDDFQSPV